MQPGTIDMPSPGTIEATAPGEGPAHSQRGDRRWSAGLTLLGGCVLAIGGLVLAVLTRSSSSVLGSIGLWRFVSGREWDPVSGAFGALPFVYGTAVTSALAIVLAAPVAIGLALFLAEMGPPALRRPVTFAVETLAAIPSVVYGLWGLFVLVPVLRSPIEPALKRALGFLPLFRGPAIGLGYLAAGIILAIMILPTIASVALDVFRTVPTALREGALALGATRWEMIRAAVLPHARRGIAGAVLLGLGRALGETMAVAMIIGNAPEIHASLLAPGYTLPSALANEFAEATSSAHQAALAGLGLVLFGMTVLLNGGARLLLAVTGPTSGGARAPGSSGRWHLRHRLGLDRLGARRATDLAATLACAFMVVLALVPLASLLWLVLSRGASGLSPGFFIHRPAPPGEAGGGVGPAVVGTLLMVGMACLLALPVGVGAGAYLAERGDRPFGRAVRFTSDVLSGVPSIVVGIVAYALLVAPMKGYSALAGACALSLVMIPPLARAAEEFVRLVPRSLREASLALGVPAWRTSLSVVLRTALPGILTAALLTVARAAGETAPLLFTALNNQYWSLRPDKPMASLTVQIYDYAISPAEDWHAQAWTAALVLLVLVGGLNLSARLLSRDRLGRAR